jgi:hypothetical protein
MVQASLGKAQHHEILGGHADSHCKSQQEQGCPLLDAPDFPSFCSFEDKWDIILEFQAKMYPQALK